MEINNIFEIDENIFTENDLSIFNNKTVYILHYPQGNFSSLSFNIIKKIVNNNEIFHLCSTEHGSSGSPILNLDTLKVIGIHQLYEKMENANSGIILKEPIYNFNKENKILLTLKINKNQLGQKISFIKYNELYLNNTILFYDNKRYKYEKYFKPKKEGTYNILIIFNLLIKDCSSLFSNCENIISLDLSSFDTKNVTDMSEMFKNCHNLTNINLSSLDTKMVTNMREMFYGCENLINLDLSSFDTKNVTDMSKMFIFCCNLENINLSSFGTDNVIDMKGMFEHCKNLNDIDLSSFVTKNVTNMGQLFCDCHNLTNLDLSSFDTKNVNNMSGMFSNCFKLNSIDLSSFDIKNVKSMSGMFSSCFVLNNINLSSFDIKNDTEIKGLLYNCDKCKTLNNIISEETIKKRIKISIGFRDWACFIGEPNYENVINNINNILNNKNKIILK